MVCHDRDSGGHSDLQISNLLFGLPSGSPLLCETITPSKQKRGRLVKLQKVKESISARLALCVSCQLIEIGIMSECIN